MSCITSYSCPITIPQGNTGAAGPAGANGTNGTSVETNTTGGTSSSTGDQSLAHYDTIEDGYITGDILRIDGDFLVTSSFVGSISLLFGSQNMNTFTVPTGLILPANSNGDITLTISAVIKFLTASTQIYESEIVLGTSPATVVKKPSANCAQDTAVSKVIDVRCAPSAGTVSCTSFVVTKFSA